MATTVTTHLMFDGAAEEAMNFYVSLFPASEITRIERYGASEGLEGKVKVATFILSGRTFMCIDTPVKHNFTFTPAISLFVDFDSQAALDEAFHQLSTRGSVFMPLDNYGFSRRFGWLQRAVRMVPKPEVDFADRDLSRPEELIPALALRTARSLAAAYGGSAELSPLPGFGSVMRITFVNPQPTA